MLFNRPLPQSERTILARSDCDGGTALTPFGTRRETPQKRRAQGRGHIAFNTFATAHAVVIFYLHPTLMHS